MIYFTCTQEEFIPTRTSQVAWLDPLADFTLAENYWLALGQKLKFSTWMTAHDFGYQYAAIIEQGAMVACAGVWKFSDACWEVAAVSTLPPHRRKGHARSTIAFVTSYILDTGRMATCSTSDDNIAMIAAAKSVGFQVIPKGEVWWAYPELPDF